tara:strand:- start:767 stop:1291 length:525 start_codon:yes stop_codon:yes gene_type:complete
MKKLILLSTFFISISVHALPNCPSDTSIRWDNCFGTYTWAEGDQYVGEWKDDKRHGQGTYTWADGDQYVGEYKDGKKHGQGTYTLANGNHYVGAFKDDKRHGQGTFTWADGDQYVGAWKDNKKHGQGTYTWADGGQEVGFYYNSQYIPDICEGMGLVKGTESYGSCVLKLIDDL